MKPWIATYTGKRFELFDPKPEMICIEDIAHALSHICRFGGHSADFYSVAQHSVTVSLLCCDEHRLHGLLHDASEAYIGDVVRPLKLMLTEYRTIESRIHSAILETFGLEKLECSCVKEADEVLLATEARQFFGMTKDYADWSVYAEPGDFRVYPESTYMAERAFLDAFRKLQ